MIDTFSGEYKFLSNFYPVKVSYAGLIFPSVEHAYQAAKTEDRGEQKKICAMKTAGEAKKYGKQVKLRRDWESAKLEIMRNLLRQKFTDPDLKKWLLDTSPQLLVEGNDWNDTFWGICDGKGKNWLGKLLMEIRAYWLNESD
jgi:ribA/ribD-fused uncharacterized protein